MSETVIRAAFETRLNAMAPALATAFENVPFQPVQGQAYQEAYLLPADPENPSLGASLARLLGFFQVTLLYPQNAGAAPAYSRAEAIRDTFPRGFSMTRDGLTVHIDGTPSIRKGEPRDSRYTVVVRIPYHVNVFSS